jgi:ABC-2 type transport system ATP-binding protein
LQESALPPRLRVGEALDLFAAFYPDPLDPQEVLESLGIKNIERASALIERMRERGVTVILVTHFMDEAETLCDRLALINRGRLAALDSPEAIAAEAGLNRVRFVPSQPVADGALYAVDGVRAVERKGRFVTVTGTGDLAASLINALTAGGVRVSELEARHGSLDDAFIRLTRQTTSAATAAA